MSSKRVFAVLAGAAMLSALLLVTYSVMSKPTALFAVGEPLSAEEEYATLNPVYTRCAKKADVASFTKEILVKCGDIHELTYCSWTCTQALQSYADSVGCCWETVIQGYEQLDASAGDAWRNWQGTASGKCGVSFAAESCGDSVGESSYKELESQVQGLASQADENSQVVKAIASLILGYGYYKQPAAGSLAQPPSKIGSISVDNVFDIPDDGNVHNGDISVPVDKLEPPLYATRRPATPPAGRAVKKARKMSLFNAYDDFRNYQNSLRLKAGYDARFKPLKEAGVQASPVDGRIAGFPVPGESWQD